jgi:hypothetical protein
MIIQRPDVIVVLTESERTFRLIYLDGRGHPEDVYDYPESLLSGTRVFNSPQGLDKVKVKQGFGIFRFELFLIENGSEERAGAGGDDCRQ